MDKFLLKTVAALDDCKHHLENTKSLESPIANYLTQYLAIIFCAEMEEMIKQLFNKCVEQRITYLSDSELKEFINNQLKRLKSSSLKKPDIADYMKLFSEDAKERFNNELQNKDKEINSYANVVNSRHAVAHTSSPNQVTFSELENAVAAAREILKAVQFALQTEQ